MGGRNGLTVAEYAALSDRQVYTLLCIEFDDDGKLVTEAAQGSRAAPSGEPDAAPQELPVPESVGLGGERLARCLALAPLAGVGFLTMYFDVWRRRGATPAQAEERWRRRVAFWERGGKAGGDGPCQATGNRAGAATTRSTKT